MYSQKTHVSVLHHQEMRVPLNVCLCIKNRRVVWKPCGDPPLMALQIDIGRSCAEIRLKNQKINTLCPLYIFVHPKLASPPNI